MCSDFAKENNKKRIFIRKKKENFPQSSKYRIVGGFDAREKESKRNGAGAKYKKIF